MQNTPYAGIAFLVLGAVFLYAALYAQVKNPSRQKITALVCILVGLILLSMYFAGLT